MGLELLSISKTGVFCAIKLKALSKNGYQLIID
jgi:hypothetical protein